MLDTMFEEMWLHEYIIEYHEKYIRYTQEGKALILRFGPCLSPYWSTSNERTAYTISIPGNLAR